MSGYALNDLLVVAYSMQRGLAMGKNLPRDGGKPTCRLELPHAKVETFTSTSLPRCDQSRANRVAYQACDIVNPEPLHELCPVLLDCLHADP